ncbi:MAG: hypothetical protein CXR30_19170 [Geobacter sp.]|nr:MAG: hypothetical protein CXR30_19170 [Geobacter sp.]
MKLDPNEVSALAAIAGTVVNSVAAFFALLSAKAARKAAEATQKSAENDLLPYTEKFRDRFTEQFELYKDATHTYGRAINKIFETGGPVDLFDNFAKKKVQWPRHVLYYALDDLVSRTSNIMANHTIIHEMESTIATIVEEAPIDDVGKSAFAQKTSEVIHAFFKDSDRIADIRAVSQELQKIKDQATDQIESDGRIKYRIGFQESERKYSYLIDICDLVLTLHNRGIQRLTWTYPAPHIAFQHTVEALAYFKAIEELIFHDVRYIKM